VGHQDVTISSGSAPSAPLNVTSITKDAGATVSFYAPASAGSSSITHYVVTPYIAGSAQSTTTVAVGSLTSLTDSSGGTALQANVASLTNSTAYTFTVKARSSFGDGPESTASGANTPLAGLVFGDDFNGPASGPIDPEWWVLNRCGYIAQSEVQWYLPSQCVLDGSGNLALTAQHTSHSGPSYPSDGNTTRNQTWISGACQSNARTFTPSGATMTFEVKQQVCADAGSGFWPGLFWLEGQTYLDAWKTDPLQQGWDSTGKAEIDVAEWFQTGAANSYGNVSWAGTNEQSNITGSTLATAMHIYQAIWTPGTNVVFKRDGSTTATHTVQVPDSGAHFFLLIYLQMLAGGATTTESCLIDYVRVFDQ
jgi:hypothetical protein